MGEPVGAGVGARHLLQEREGGQVPQPPPAQPLPSHLSQRGHTTQHQGGSIKNNL